MKRHAIRHQFHGQSVQVSLGSKALRSGMHSVRDFTQAVAAGHQIEHQKNTLHHLE
jgi:hypothetical protein